MYHRHTLLCLFVAMLSSCVAWQENVALHGVKFERARVDSRGFVIGYIAADSVVGGRPCRAGWVHLHVNGVPAGFTASREIVLPRFTIPEGTWVFQNAEGVVTVCAFPRDVEIQGQWCRGGVGGSEGVQTAFYGDGALKQFFPPVEVVIDGVPCRSSLFEAGIELYENGRLRGATAAKDVTVDGRVYRRGERVVLPR